MSADDFAASNEPGTCLWCGRKLRPLYKGSQHHGYYGHGLFDRLQCAYLFAKAFADMGKRLQPKEADNAEAL